MAEQVYDSDKFTEFRLPKFIKPIHYDIRLGPNFNAARPTFSGEVKIQLECTGMTNTIVLHALELRINEGSYHNNSTGTDTPLETVYYTKDTQTATLEFRDDVTASGTLHLKFNGILNDKLKGFYRTTLRIGKSTAHAATTQFEPNNARRCFPCWDEPAVKATFSVSLTIEKFMFVDGKQYERVALSNMPEIGRLGADNELEIRFARTPVMSTYLLAIVIGPFEAIEGTDGRRPIRVFTQVGKKEQGRFVLEAACKSLPYYEDYFAIDYHLPKLDFIVIPDFEFRAMENWGLITCEEACLLVDPGHASERRKLSIATLVAHELAHQWFGNLVTMEWWTHLWLHESLASFMECLCTDHIFPEYDAWSRFVAHGHVQALELDSLHDSHPIEIPVNRESEVNEIFDEFTYQKGGAVIRMLHNYIGDDCFREGMRDYLNKFAYKSSTTQDLWDCLEAASGMPVARLMSGWTQQRGFPWLSIKYFTQADQVKLEVTQAKFTADGTIRPEDADSNWIIPISAVTGKNPHQAETICLLDDKSSVLTIEGAADTWVKLNSGTVGLYRSAYPEVMLEKLRAAIEDKSLPPLDRLGILSDYFALCQAGKVNTVDLLRLLQAYRRETEYTVWNLISSCIGRLNTILMHTDFHDKFRAFSRKLFGDIFQTLTWTARASERHVDGMTRSLVLKSLIASGDQNVIAEARLRFRSYLCKKEVIPANLRAAVYSAIATYGDSGEFLSLVGIYQESKSIEEKHRLLDALASAKTKERLDCLIDFVSDGMGFYDRIFVLAAMSVTNPTIAWKFLQDQKDFLRNNCDDGLVMSHLVGCLTENFASEEKAREIGEFFKQNKFPGVEKAVQRSLEIVRLNAEWSARDSESIEDFLSASW